MKDFLGLNGKCALVIGGGLGMGEATSLTFAEAGCDVAIVDIDAERAERVAAGVRDLGRKAIAISANVVDDGAAADVVAQVERDLGPIDIAASIVGQASWNKVLDLTPQDWDLDHRRNLRYFFFMAQAVARAMVKGGRPGVITAIASVSGMQSAPNHSAYGAAKAGLINLVRSMGVELAEHGIRINAVAPGVIKTPRTAAIGDPEEMAKRIRDSLIPYRRQGDPQDIANGVLFLSSDLASFITGVTLPVDGGFTSQFLLGYPRGA